MSSLTTLATIHINSADNSDISSDYSTYSAQLPESIKLNVPNGSEDLFVAVNHFVFTNTFGNVYTSDEIPIRIGLTGYGDKRREVGEMWGRLRAPKDGYISPYDVGYDLTVTDRTYQFQNWEIIIDTFPFPDPEGTFKARNTTSWIPVKNLYGTLTEITGELYSYSSTTSNVPLNTINLFPSVCLYDSVSQKFTFEYIGTGLTTGYEDEIDPRNMELYPYYLDSGSTMPSWPISFSFYCTGSNTSTLSFLGLYRKNDVLLNTLTKDEKGKYTMKLKVSNESGSIIMNTAASGYLTNLIAGGATLIAKTAMYKTISFGSWSFEAPYIIDVTGNIREIQIVMQEVSPGILHSTDGFVGSGKLAVIPLTSTFGYAQVFYPTLLTWLSLSGSELKGINLYFRDNDGDPIDFGGIPWSLQLSVGYKEEGDSSMVSAMPNQVSTSGGFDPLGGQEPSRRVREGLMFEATQGPKRARQF